MDPYYAQSPAHLSGVLSRLFSQAMNNRLAPHKVTPAQYPVLLNLWETDGLTQQELCALVGIEQPTMANTLKRMERDGLVRKVPDDNDRRKIRIRLTKRARELQPILTASAEEVLASAAQDMAMTEAEQLVALMNRMILSLQRDVDQTPLLLNETLDDASLEPPAEDAEPLLLDESDVLPEPEPEPEPEPLLLEEVAPEPAEVATEVAADDSPAEAEEAVLELVEEVADEPLDAAPDLDAPSSHAATADPAEAAEAARVGVGSKAAEHAAEDPRDGGDDPDGDGDIDLAVIRD